MQISVIGLGWFGLPLARELVKSGHHVVGSCRSEEKLIKLRSENINAHILNYPDLPSSQLLNAEIIILNIPPFQEELEWFKTWNITPDTWIIFISSTSKSPLLLSQEEWISSTFKNWTVLRFGGLIGGGRHPGKHLSGRKNLPGRLWPVNLIHQDDVVKFTKLVIEKNIQKETIEVVSDEHPTREQFYSDYCQDQNLPMPEFSLEDHSVKPPISSERLKHYYSDFTPLKKL